MNSNNIKSELRTDAMSYDILVIGAGISGVGVALESQRRGYKTLLLERSADLASGTSANSLKIIHGGFRYLQSLDFPRVLNSVSAQAALVQKYPKLFSALPCLMPLKTFGLRSKYPVLFATLLFKIIAKGLGWPSKEHLPAVISNIQDSKLLKGQSGSFLLWWDWQAVSHPDLVATLATEFIAAGGKIRTSALVTEVQTSAQLASIILADETKLNAKIAIDCRGSGVPSNKVKSHAMAFNLRLRRALDTKYGVGMTTSGRLLFAVPRSQPSAPEEKGAVGTWYIPDADPFDDAKPTVSEAQISAAIADVNAALPQAQLMREDVIGLESGVLPCVSAQGVDPVVLLGRERIETHGRIVSVVSTKYTTFETQARWAVDTAEEIIKFRAAPGARTAGPNG